jgi:hypothetical protein
VSSAFVPVTLEDLPIEAFDGAVTYLADVLRECQLLVLGHGHGTAVTPSLAALAETLVPELEGLREVFRSAEIRVGERGYRAWAEMRGSDAAMLAALQVHLVQLRVLGRQGGTLVASDPEVSRFVDWICEELADQLSGRPARAYRA